MKSELRNRTLRLTHAFISLPGIAPGLGSFPEAQGMRTVRPAGIRSGMIPFLARRLRATRAVWFRLCLALLLFESQPMRALQPELTVRWREQVIGGNGFESSVVEDEGRVFLRVANKTHAPCVVRLGRFESPGLDHHPYAWLGEIRYKGVAGSGYMESWNEFVSRNPAAPGPRYFSRTKSESGPMADLRGSSPWRPFVLPFTPDPTGGGPKLIELNLHLPDVGTVDIGPLTLVQPEGGLDSLGVGALGGGWWSPRQSGVVSGIVGCLLGCSGAVLGTLIRRGKGRSGVLAAHWILITLGVLSFGVGLYARSSGQPAHVWFTCVLFGLIIAPGYGLSVVHTRRQYIDAEMRRMQAADARM